MRHNFSTRVSKLFLLATAIIWGAAFVVMNNALVSVPPFQLLAMRFGTGAVLLAVVFAVRWKSFHTGYLWRGAVLGTFIFLAYAIQSIGLLGTTSAKSSFLTTSYCIIVPFLSWAVSGKRPDIYHCTAALLCVVGIGLVSLNEQLSITWGDGLTLVCAIFFAAHIVTVSIFAKQYDVLLLTVLQFGFAALLSIAAGLISESWTIAIFTHENVFSLIYLCLFATTIALLFQNIGQKNTSPMSASLILASEALFGTLFSVLYFKERFTFQVLFGFAVIAVSIIISETKLGFLHKCRDS